jgi:hypothetical protein
MLVGGGGWAWWQWWRPSSAAGGRVVWAHVNVIGMHPAGWGRGAVLVLCASFNAVVSVFLVIASDLDTTV